MTRQAARTARTLAPASGQSARLAELKKETLYQQAYEQLRLALMAGHMLPGSSLSLRVLAEELGVSPMPVRDALNRLITQRALELLPNRTVRVPVLTAARFDELTQVRVALEGELSRQAATRMDAEGSARMVAMNDQMEVAAEHGDIRRFLELNYEFHFTLYRAAASEIRFAIVESLWLQSGPVLNEYLQKSGFVYARGHHANVCQGLADTNPDMVADAIQNDIRVAAAAVSKTMT